MSLTVSTTFFGLLCCVAVVLTFLVIFLPVFFATRQSKDKKEYYKALDKYNDYLYRKGTKRFYEAIKRGEEDK